MGLDGAWVGGWAQRGLKSMGVWGVNQMIWGSGRENHCQCRLLSLNRKKKKKRNEHNTSPYRKQIRCFADAGRALGMEGMQGSGAEPRRVPVPWGLKAPHCCELRICN